MTSIQGQRGQGENSFWLKASESIDFFTQYLANKRIFGDDLVDFPASMPSYKYTSEEYHHLTYYILIMSMDL